MKVTFDEVAIRSSKSGKCLCGKPRTRTRKFYQTLNPFNKNAAGAPKSRREIETELVAEAAAWRKEPIYCESCEPAAVVI